MALENDKTKNLEILEKIKEEIALKAKLNLDELLEKEKIKNQEKVLIFLNIFKKKCFTDFEELITLFN